MVPGRPRLAIGGGVGTRGFFFCNCGGGWGSSPDSRPPRARSPKPRARKGIVAGRAPDPGSRRKPGPDPASSLLAGHSPHPDVSVAEREQALQKGSGRPCQGCRESLPVAESLRGLASQCNRWRTARDCGGQSRADPARVGLLPTLVHQWQWCTRALCSFGRTERATPCNSPRYKHVCWRGPAEHLLLRLRADRGGQGRGTLGCDRAGAGAQSPSLKYLSQTLPIFFFSVTCFAPRSV